MHSTFDISWQKSQKWEKVFIWRVRISLSDWGFWSSDFILEFNFMAVFAWICIFIAIQPTRYLYLSRTLSSHRWKSIPNVTVIEEHKTRPNVQFYNFLYIQSIFSFKLKIKLYNSLKVCANCETKSHVIYRISYITLISDFLELS
jgi:hypothetical protein